MVQLNVGNPLGLDVERWKMVTDTATPWVCLRCFSLFQIGNPLLGESIGHYIYIFFWGGVPKQIQDTCLVFSQNDWSNMSVVWVLFKDVQMSIWPAMFRSMLGSSVPDPIRPSKANLQQWVFSELHVIGFRFLSKSVNFQVVEPSRWKTIKSMKCSWVSSKKYIAWH